MRDPPTRPCFRRCRVVAAVCCDPYTTDLQGEGNNFGKVRATTLAGVFAKVATNTASARPTNAQNCVAHELCTLRSTMLCAAHPPDHAFDDAR